MPHLTRFRSFLCLLLLGALLAGRPAAAAPRWTPEQANAWYQKTGWLVGCNYGPATAINQLEMWQAETFDLETIDRELALAESLGFNSIRVYLHDLLWKQDAEGFAGRIDRFLQAADRRKIGVMFVLFDSVWDPHPHLGRQRAATPHLHNSGWVQSPGAEVLRDPSRHEELKGYVQGLLRRFGKDRRVQVWDLWNEPDNNNGNSYRAWEPPDKGNLVLPLLKKVYAWAQEADPDQPITTAVWLGDWSAPEKLKPWERFQLDESDIITYHDYGNLESQQRRVAWLKRYGRPILCTEYMARPMGSTFESVLPFLKEQNVGAYNWGFVAGKTQTIYPWDSWNRQYTAEPPLWFHDIFRPDGTPYREEEVRLIRRLTGKERADRPRAFPRALQSRPLARRFPGREKGRPAAAVPARQ
jgi:hypothetical protein